VYLKVDKVLSILDWSVYLKVDKVLRTYLRAGRVMVLTVDWAEREYLGYFLCGCIYLISLLIIYFILCRSVLSVCVQNYVGYIS
jgi:hypothetical protein